MAVRSEDPAPLSRGEAAKETARFILHGLAA
jgi:hypothetical protein